MADDDDDERHEEQDFVEQVDEATHTACSSDEDKPGEMREKQDDQDCQQQNSELTLEEAAELDAIAFLCDEYGIDGDFDINDVQAKAAKLQPAATAMASVHRGRSRSGQKEQSPYNMSTADLKKKLAELKSRTKSTDCGRRGHQSGDPQCPMAHETGASSSRSSTDQVRTSRMSTVMPESNIIDECCNTTIRARSQPEIVQELQAQKRQRKSQPVGQSTCG